METNPSKIRTAFMWAALAVAAIYGLLAFHVYEYSKGEPHGFGVLVAAHHLTGSVSFFGLALAVSRKRGLRYLGLALALLGGIPFLYVWFL